MTDEHAIVRDGNVLILAYDHGLEHGPDDLLAHRPSADPEHVFELGEHEDVTAMAVQKGLAERYAPSYDVPLLVKLNGKTALGTGAPYSALNCTVERAVELGADAVGYTLYPGSDREGEMFETFRVVQEVARDYGIPVVAWSYPRGGTVEDDTAPGIVKYAARVALELGADIAKVKHPGSVEDARDAADLAGETLVTLSGGAKGGAREFLEDVHTVMEGGFAGLAVGRNVFQREDAERYLDALGDVVYGRAGPDEAMERAGIDG